MSALVQYPSKPRPCLTVLRSDPYNDPDEGTALEFRLVYNGTLLGASKKDTRSTHKHEIRRAFHPQLKRLWEITPHLNSATDPMLEDVVTIKERRVSRLDELANKFVLQGFNFVPLVTSELSLICGIEVLFLRPDYPGSVMQSGDIDNRLKTIFDAFRIPKVGELDKRFLPSEGETPFYTLLEDDSLITKLSVETDTLLQPTGTQANGNDARLIITVKLRPANLNWDNMVFG